MKIIKWIRQAMTTLWIKYGLIMLWMMLLSGLTIFVYALMAFQSSVSK